MGSPSAAADLRADVFIGPYLHFEHGGGTFSATTSTLVSGKSDAVLIDAQHISTDVDVLGDMIERTSRRLTTIYTSPMGMPITGMAPANLWRDSRPLGVCTPGPGESPRPVLPGISPKSPAPYQ